MATVKSLEDLKRLKKEILEQQKVTANAGRAQITVGLGTCGIAAGARETMKSILAFIEAENLSGIIVAQTGCIGLCEWEPVVEVAIGSEAKITYGKVSPEKARQIMQAHVMGGKIIPEYLIPA